MLLLSSCSLGVIGGYPVLLTGTDTSGDAPAPAPCTELYMGAIIGAITDVAVLGSVK